MTAPPTHLDADWPAPPNVRALTTLRCAPGVSIPPFDRFNLGLRNGDDLGHATQNRQQLQALFALPSPPRWLQQVHGTGVVAVVESAGAEPIGDASTTVVPGCVLAILTADCLPVAFCNRSGTEVGAAHAGWRSLAAGVLEATVCAMQSDPADLMAWMGPAAGPQRYEVGAEVRDAFIAADPGASVAFAATRPGHWLIDLYAIARQRLSRCGVGSVHGGGLCTISDSARFYSHRRDARTGRMATLVWMARDAPAKP